MDKVIDELSDPLPLLSWSLEDLFSLPEHVVEDFRLRAARQYFTEMRPKIGFLDRLATNQGVEHIDSIDDIAPVLFAHTAYKSYPLSLLERGDFSRLTRWLSQLTSHDLSSVDASRAESIEQWLVLLDTTTPLRVVITSATSGKLSFLPISLPDIPAYHLGAWHNLLPFKSEPGVDIMVERMPLVHFGYRDGFSSTHRRRFDEKLLTSVHSLYPALQSPDMLSLVGRLASSASGRDLRTVQLTPLLTTRREDFLRVQTERGELIRSFIKLLVEELNGQRVVTVGAWSQMIAVALAAEAMGISKVFAPDSLVTTGGGLKGTEAPPDYRERIKKFMGVTTTYDTYGMTEETLFLRACAQGNFHVPPFVVPFALDPDTGEPSARHGDATGRFALLDLFPRTYWGGFVTGDEVTIHWDGGCRCERTGAYLDPTIARYSELRGGDDKISCSGVQSAYDRAIGFMVDNL